jgi:hypothetical protein
MIKAVLQKQLSTKNVQEQGGYDDPCRQEDTNGALGLTSRYRTKSSPNTTTRNQNGSICQPESTVATESCRKTKSAIETPDTNTTTIDHDKNDVPVGESGGVARKKMPTCCSKGVTNGKL